MSVTFAHDGNGGLGRALAAELRRLRRVVRRRFQQALAAAIGVGMAAGGAWLVADGDGPGLRGAGPDHVFAEEPAWVDIARPFQFFALPAPELSRLPRAYEARRHRDGGGREDILSFGAFDGSGLYIRMIVHRLGGEPAAPASFFVDLARRGAAAGLAVERAGAPSLLPTRFGPAEVGDMALSSARADNVACLAFRFAIGAGVAQAAGFACGGDKAPERSSLACLIDRLDLVAASDDADLRKAFAASELRRDPACGPKGSGARVKPAAFEALVAPPTLPPAAPKAGARGR